MRATSAFNVEAQPGQRIVIEVDTSSKGAFVGGIVLVSVSPVVSLVGLVVYLANSISFTGGTEGGRTAGIGLAVGGLAGVVIGVVMIVSNASSKQTQSPAGSAPPARDALRQPIWAEVERAGSPAYPAPSPPPPTLDVPVLRF